MLSYGITVVIQRCFTLMGQFTQGYWFSTFISGLFKHKRASEQTVLTFFHPVHFFSFQLIKITITYHNAGKDSSTLSKSEKFYLHCNHPINLKNYISIIGLLNGKYFTCSIYSTLQIVVSYH